jgi:hypothetical protein
MKHFLIFMLTVLSVLANAEVIKIQTPYSASHSGTPALLAVIEQANQIQQDYTFVLEFKPGANQLLSVKEMDQDPQNKLSVVFQCGQAPALRNIVKSFFHFAQQYIGGASVGIFISSHQMTVDHFLRGKQRAGKTGIGGCFRS